MDLKISLFIFSALTSASLAQNNAGPCSSMHFHETQFALCNNTDLSLSVECNSRESWPANTIVEIRCPDSWKPTKDSTVNKIITVCANGNWLDTKQTLRCEEDCRWSDSVADIDDEHGPWPWNVGIFTEDRVGSGNFSFTCSGTLVSSKAILTAAQCLQYTLQRQTVFLNPQDIRIYSGNLNYASQGNASSKHHPVGKVVLHDNYNPIDFESDLAVITLKNPIKESKSLHPICIPRGKENSDEITSGRLVALNGGMSARLALLSHISSRKCQNSSSTHSKLVRGSTFCAGIKKGSEACIHYAGAGFVSIASNSTRLKGIRTGLPFSCNQPIVFTRLSEFNDWILREVHGIIKPVTKTTSTTTTRATTTTTARTTTTTTTPQTTTRKVNTIPPYVSASPYEMPRTTSRTNALSIQTRRPETDYDPRRTNRPRPVPTTRPPLFSEDDDDTHISSWEQAVLFNHSNSNHQTSHYPNYLAIQTTKAPRTTPKPKYTERPTTQREPDRPLSLPDDDLFSYRQKRCPPLDASDGALITCQHSQGRGDECNDGGWAGSKATYRCRKHYTPVFGFDSIQRNCSEQGNWRPSAEFGCKLNCGVSSLPKNAFIVNGAVSDRVSWPWHATIFRNISDDWAYRCGGALISKNVILTAAHCVTNLGKTSIIPRGELLVVLAAKSSNYDQNLDDQHAKIFSVQKVSIPETYNAVTFNSDIALIQLATEVELSDYVKPVCWPSRRNADHRNLERIHLEYSSTIKGYAVGFGVDENGRIGEALKEAALPYVTAQACREALDRTPTDSQFCAGYTNGTSTAVCNGDSGGGLYFADTTQSSTKFIIQGIISNGDTYKGNKDSSKFSKYCNYNNYAVFTRVINFSPWIHSFLDSIEDNRRSSSELN